MAALVRSNQDKAYVSDCHKRSIKPVEWKDVPHEKHSKIFNLLKMLKRKLDQFGEISKHKARLVMDGSRAQIGVDVFDTYAPVIDYSTVLLLISLAFGNNWELLS